MYVSGFTIARNVVKADYPIKEAIESILPLCDEVIVAVGKSEDTTLEFVQNLASVHSKIKIIETIWDDNLREGGIVLAAETNKALEAVSEKADWCIYIQADECMHEKDIPEIKASMEIFKDDEKVEGFLFNYRHFYGSYDYIGDSRKWYRKEIRIVRNGLGVESYKDAQGFRLEDRKLKVKPLNAHIHHYGWVKHPDVQKKKVEQANKLWHDDEYIEEKISSKKFDYLEQMDSLVEFKESHPIYIQDRIAKVNWKFDYDISKKNFTFKNRILYWIEKCTGLRIGEYKNYEEI